MAGIIITLLYTCKYAFLASFLSENYIIVTRVDEARKANLHAYERMTIRSAIYERGLCDLLRTQLQHESCHLNYTKRQLYHSRTKDEKCHTSLMA